MMYDIKMFSNKSELMQLTALSDDEELYDNGFLTGGWNIGLQSDKPLDIVKHSKYVDHEFYAPNEESYLLIWAMKSFGNGYVCVKYKDKYYYLTRLEED